MRGGRRVNACAALSLFEIPHRLRQRTGVDAPDARLPFLPLDNQPAFNQRVGVMAEERKADADVLSDLGAGRVRGALAQEVDDAESRRLTERLEDRGASLQRG